MDEKLLKRFEKDQLLNKRIGILFVSEYAGLKHNKLSYLCICDCGERKQIIGSHLKTGRSKSCGSCRNNLIGKKFHRLQVISKHGKDRNNKTLWNCLCDCGKLKQIKTSLLLRGITKSCGCLQKDIMRSKRGDKSGNWNPLLSDSDRIKRHKLSEVSEWRKSIFNRDNYSCVICSSKKKLNAHHLDSWHWCVDKRFDINNGVTLCNLCHKEFHKLYKYKNNTSIEFHEYRTTRMAAINEHTS
jgi:hypothetical protein